MDVVSDGRMPRRPQKHRPFSARGPAGAGNGRWKDDDLFRVPGVMGKWSARDPDTLFLLERPLACENERNRGKGLVASSVQKAERHLALISFDYRMEKTDPEKSGQRGKMRIFQRPVPVRIINTRARGAGCGPHLSRAGGLGYCEK